MRAKEDDVVTRWIHDIAIPAALMSYAYRAVQKKFAKELAPYHIGEGHFTILMLLYDEDGCSQDELAHLRGYNKTLITKSVVRLEEEGLIRRVNDMNDKRVKRLYLTETGRALCPVIERIGLDINRNLFKNFTKSESAVILEYLRKIAMNASEM